VYSSASQEGKPRDFLKQLVSIRTCGRKHGRVLIWGQGPGGTIMEGRTIEVGYRTKVLQGRGMCFFSAWLGAHQRMSPRFASS